MASVDDDEILEVLRESDAVELTTTVVAESLPVTRGTTRNRLQALVDDGTVARRREGNNVVWWLPEREGEAGAADEEPADADDGGDAADPVAAETDATASTESLTEMPPDEGATEPAEAAGPATDDADGDATAEAGAPHDATENGADTDEATDVVDHDGVDVEATDDGVEVVVDSEEFPVESDDGLLRAAAVAVGALVVVALLRRLLRR